MSDAPLDLPVIGTGRAADVYDLGDGTVLRRYRREHDAALEGRVMEWARAAGVPVPKTHRAEGRDLVMDMVPGPTMMQVLERAPWKLITHARLLASLQRRVNAVDAPDWLHRRDGVRAGDALLHMDLHPMNVILSPSGPVIIDWTNATRGAPAFDAAMTYILARSVEGSNMKERVGSRAFAAAFASARGRRGLRGVVADAARFRLEDPNVTAAERRTLERLAGQR